MKAIVTNLILGSVASTIYMGSPVWADAHPKSHRPNSVPAILSAKALNQQVFALPPVWIFEPQSFDYSLSLEDKEYIKALIEQNSWSQEQNLINSTIDLVNQEVASLNNASYASKNTQENLVLGKHNTFWHNNNDNYWGLTTIKTWGNKTGEDLSLPKLNYLNSAPLLAPNSSTLTISGGAADGLTGHNNNIEEIGEFHGGIAFHQSVADEVTVGLGFVYEDFLVGFSQLTYQPDNFPLKTTVSLLQKEEGLEVHSHLKLQPLEEMVFNLYSDEKEQKFDFNWDLVSGFTLTADGNSETESLRAGAKLAVNNELFSLLAKAQLDNNNEIQWQLTSRLGSFHLSYATDSLKTNTKLQYDFNDLAKAGFLCSFFVNNQTRKHQPTEDNLTVWGWNFKIADQTIKDRTKWEFNLGYGFGTAGEGAIAYVKSGINPFLSLKLSYEQVSLVSDDTLIKLQLSSN